MCHEKVYNNLIMNDLQFKVIIEQDMDGVFVASVPAIPGCHTQGATYEEAVRGIEEAIQLCLEVAKEDKEYKEKIDFSEISGNKSRFLGVLNIPVPFKFSL
jgi:predicted RNase H-like HicB family nuclease